MQPKSKRTWSEENELWLHCVVSATIDHCQKCWKIWPCNVQSVPSHSFKSSKRSYVRQLGTQLHEAILWPLFNGKQSLIRDVAKSVYAASPSSSASSFSVGNCRAAISPCTQALCIGLIWVRTGETILLTFSRPTVTSQSLHAWPRHILKILQHLGLSSSDTLHLPQYKTWHILSSIIIKILQFQAANPQAAGYDVKISCHLEKDGQFLKASEVFTNYRHAEHPYNAVLHWKRCAVATHCAALNN